jgi:hypothetical protein
MVTEEPTSDNVAAGWLSAVRRAIDNLVAINQNLEKLRKDNGVLRQQIIELGKVVSYQAGQIQQIDHRIKDAVTARVLQELARSAELSLPVGRAALRDERSPRE